MIKVYSEIGKLRSVLLHRPGNELENLAPKYLSDLLFDDIPYLEKAREEHDVFAQLLRDNGVKVNYITHLLSNTLKSNELKEQFLNEFLDLSDINNKYIREALKDYLLNMNISEMIDKLTSGIRTNELKLKKEVFSVKVRKSNMDIPFFLNPMPNLYFQRDPVAMIGKGATINRMRTPARRRESMFMEYVLKYNEDFKNTPLYYDKKLPYAIEGGDILIFNEKVLAVGISQRTDPEALEILAKKIFDEYDDTFETILGFLIPAKRAYMHLDTVFTQLDYDKFVVHPEMQEVIKIFGIQKKDHDEYTINEEKGTLKEILEKHLDVDKITLLKCGNGDEIAAAREQWNDGSNTLAIEPGTVITYDRNYITNKELKNAGIKVIEFPASELSRGRGGPRCMSMPLIRDDI
ncbi:MULTISPECIES: arginine deiminase [Oceanotoga]|jgi:arginine deiminase|uniref:Arginine deiminase n=1 Tax=Oceanotoga teriensis TaxID=515440 RepID=A0AA45C6L8_9BACT|nr:MULTISPECIES: arginine deiminase [Oceanotoga]MDN5342568.1 arginine deiminase [Oceanotoga sp.]MDO7977063.1 arginine deiminase [Oceanotoga teriensis]PWJ92179.1 arginine deiminase [Oceanotoga teriensis]